MPNGKPGDHPLTDLLVHRIPVFGSEADSLIREICQLGGEALIEGRQDVMDLAWDAQWRKTLTPQELDGLVEELRSIRNELLEQRKHQGWEV